MKLGGTAAEEICEQSRLRSISVACAKVRQDETGIAADIIRMKDGILIEHWDVIQDEATKTSQTHQVFCINGCGE